jgi:O-antigen ligase
LVFIFSIYQHLEYFPAVAVALAVMAGIGLWGRSPVTHPLIGILFPLVAIHAVASMSINAVIGGVAGMAVFAVFYWRDTKSRWQAVGTVAIAILAGALYAGFVVNAPIAGNDRAALATETRAQVPNSASFQPDWSVSGSSTARMTEQWHFFGSGIVSSPKAFLFGHASRPDRDTHPSAHNYWLDMAYNFGALATLPLLALLLVSARSFWSLGVRAWSDPLLIGAAFASVYLVLFEGLINVGMRQPYAGIITFFVFGLLITRIGLARSRTV